MKIGFVTVNYPEGFKSLITTEVVRLLEKWGALVEIIYPEERVVDLGQVRPEHDLYVLKSRTELALAFAGVLHAMGAAILNPYPVSAVLRDKITSTQILRAAGIPTPDTYVTAHPEQLAPLLSNGPIAVKPYRGSGTRGVHIVWDADELDDIPADEGPIVAQSFVGRMEHSMRIYRIGSHLFGVQRPWPPENYEEKVGAPFTITPALRGIALRCGQAFGLTAYGVDILARNGTPYVVDVHSFPGFKGVPDAALRLADYIYHVCRGVLAGGPSVLKSEDEELSEELKEAA